MICPRYFFGFSLAHLFNFPRRLFCPIQHATHCYRVFFNLVSELIGSLWLRLNKGLPSLNILVYLVCYVIIVLVSPFFLHSSNIQALVRLGKRLARQAEKAGRSHSKSALADIAPQAFWLGSAIGGHGLTVVAAAGTSLLIWRSLGWEGRHPL